jgi:hypothetical protein
MSSPERLRLTGATPFNHFSTRQTHLSHKHEEEEQEEEQEND